MKQLRCLIIDDEPLARKVIREYLEEIGGTKWIEECKSGIEANQFLENNDADIVFLDINMPKLSGLQWLRQLEKRPMVILTTAYSKHAVEAFEVEAFDFLVKPISFDRFLSSMNKVKRRISENIETLSEFITIKEGKRLYKISLADIDYLQAFGDYIRIYTPDKTFITKERLHQILLQIPHFFIQVHRSYVVNLRRVSYLEGNFVVIGQEQIPVSSKYKQTLLSSL